MVVCGWRRRHLRTDLSKREDRPLEYNDVAPALTLELSSPLDYSVRLRISHLAFRTIIRLTSNRNP